MVQRAGRIDRIGTDFETLWIYNMFPDKGIGTIAWTVESLSKKIADIDRAGFLDASVLGETVHPKTLTLFDGSGTKMAQLSMRRSSLLNWQATSFLCSSFGPLWIWVAGRCLSPYLTEFTLDLLNQVPKVYFFYFQASASEGGTHHFWKYLDLKDQRIIDNRYIIANTIACDRDTPRVVDSGDVSLRF